MSDLKQGIDEMPTSRLAYLFDMMMRFPDKHTPRFRQWIIAALIKAAREETDAKITGELEEWLL